MFLKLRQVFFNKDQKLDEHCTPYDCTGKEPELYENQHILDLVDKGDHYNNQYWGLTSWRKYEKTELHYKDIVTDMSINSGYDVYLYNNYGNEFNLLQNEDFPIGKVIKRLYSTGVIPYKNPNLEWVNIFCNYWVARPEIVDQYVETFLKPVRRAMEQDKEIVKILKEHKLPYRNKQYPYHPFIMEYLFGLFLHHNPHVTYHRIPDKTLKRQLQTKNMKPLTEIFENYKEEQLFSGGGDKGTIHHYIESYDRLFTPKRMDAINVLEIGINRGESLAMWREYFPNANIYGIDIKLPKENIEGVTMLECSQIDQLKLNELFKDINFDIVVDDGSHKIQHQLLSAKYLWSKMNKDGLYIIEDIQEPDLDIPVLSEGFRKPTEVIDTRKVSGRYDDILLVWRK